jgi:outer membrane protein OmpA-like peptidoglycan-associated protein
MKHQWITGIVISAALGCAPQPGPDKQGAGLFSGAATGAGAGAVTGFQMGAGTGPGALVGAGVGAAAGAMQGFVKDQLEEDMLSLAAGTQKEREVAVAHEILVDHYRRRMELHPTRDIYPADLFFCGDSVRLRGSAEAVVREIARLNRSRYSWSRLVVAMYVKSKEVDSAFAQRLAQRRARAFGDELVRAGIDPRRIEARGVVVDAPVLLDPADDPDRYSQAVELIPADR